MRVENSPRVYDPSTLLLFMADWYQATGYHSIKGLGFRMIESPKPWVDELVYRVAIEHDCVKVMSFCTKDGIIEVDESIEGTYDDLDSLPKWIQERIALLSMLSYKPPTVTVEGVGRRISKDTYWVHRPDPC